jgi:hypothetical protein
MDHPCTESLLSSKEQWLSGIVTFKNQHLAKQLKTQFMKLKKALHEGNKRAKTHDDGHIPDTELPKEWLTWRYCCRPARPNILPAFATKERGNGKFARTIL